MKIRTFLDAVEHEKIHKAIQAAEQGTAARIVIYVSHHNLMEPLASAHPIFKKLRLETADEKAGLLIFIAPKSHRFAVLGGTAIHEKLGQEWLEHLVGVIAGHFKGKRYTEGLLAALTEAGQTFKKHFPSDKSRPAAKPDIYDDQ